MLFEERDGEYFKGHTTNYMVVKYKTNEDIENEILNIKITDANSECIVAE